MFEGTFPLGITQLKNLRVLDLSSTNLSGGIPNSIGNLSLLSELHLYDNGLSGGLPWELSNLTYLTVLDCSNSSLSGQLPSLTSLIRLERILVSFNNLMGKLSACWNIFVPLLLYIYSRCLIFFVCSSNRQFCHCLNIEKIVDCFLQVVLFNCTS